MADPDPEAWVSAPGITMEEAKALVAAGEAERDKDLVNRVRAAVMDGLDELLRGVQLLAHAPGGLRRLVDGSGQSVQAHQRVLASHSVRPGHGSAWLGDDFHGRGIGLAVHLHTHRVGTRENDGPLWRAAATSASSCAAMRAPEPGPTFLRFSVVKKTNRSS